MTRFLVLRIFFLFGSCIDESIIPFGNVTGNGILVLHGHLSFEPFESIDIRLIFSDLDFTIESLANARDTTDLLGDFSGGYIWITCDLLKNELVLTFFLDDNGCKILCSMPKMCSEDS